MSIEELVSRVFATRNLVHLQHWKSQSFAEHSALGDFYETLIDGIDEIIEDAQGAFGLIGDVDCCRPVEMVSIIDHIADEAEWIEANRDAISRGCKALQARIDDFMSEYLRVVYKLSNLK